MDYTFTSTFKEDYDLYDKIVGATIINIFSLSKDTDKIILKNFDYKSHMHRVFLETAFSINILNKKKVAVDMPLFHYLYFKYIKMRKRNSLLTRAKNSDNGINIYDVADFEAREFNKTICVFEDIYKAYYKKVYGRD